MTDYEIEAIKRLKEERLHRTFDVDKLSEQEILLLKEAEAAMDLDRDLEIASLEASDVMSKIFQSDVMSKIFQSDVFSSKISDS